MMKRAREYRDIFDKLRIGWLIDAVGNTARRIPLIDRISRGGSKFIIEKKIYPIPERENVLPESATGRAVYRTKWWLSRNPGLIPMVLGTSVLTNMLMRELVEDDR